MAKARENEKPKPLPMQRFGPSSVWGETPRRAPADAKPIGSKKKGGKIKKTGTYRLHKGEKVVPAKKKK